MATRQAVKLYDSAGGAGFVVAGSLPPFVPNTPPDIVLYNGRMFVRDGNADDNTLRYREARSYGMVEADMTQ